MIRQSAQTAVFDIPELVQSILVFLDPRTLNIVRGLNRAFHLHCEPHFSILLIIGHRQRYEQLRELANLAKEKSGSRSPVDVIRSLHLSYQHNMYQQFQEFVLQSLASVLNRCRNLREITIVDRPWDKGIPTEKPQYLDRIAWANFDVHQNNSCSPVEDDGKPWSYIDILPLEGPMLCGLETLKIEAGTCTPVKLDRFFNRLGKSAAANTLRSLSVISSWSRVRSTSWDTLRKCICGLKALEVLMLNSFKIEQSLVDNKIPKDNNGESIWLAPRVKVLTVKCRPNLDLKLAIMDLFPNVESLYLGNTTDLWEKAVDDQLIPKTSTRTSPSKMDAVALPTSTPFPRLKLLDVAIRCPTDWEESLLLRLWARGHPHFQLQSLLLRATERPINQPINEDLVSTLAKYPLSVKDLVVTGRDRLRLCQFLKSNIFRKLETLEAQDFGLDFIEVVQQVLRPELSAKEWQIAQYQERSLRDLLPWSGTLTRLLLTSSNRVGYYSAQEEVWKALSIYSLQSLLQMLPQLEDFELSEPIGDLALFDGLGRQRVIESDDTDMNVDRGLGFGLELDMDMTWSSASTIVFEDYSMSQELSPLGTSCMTDRPMLKRLSLVQSYHFQDPRYYDPLTPWHMELKYKFKFLIDLDLKRQRSPHG
ncbi:hypothetical protein EMPS_00808 [Entomortierella parvispora]|uniref:Uncharacterized protein n=1 Tax=Entomortierella parvispora TaxID=205924 RepID=A0A9P3H2E6_9FUNG|nr:hypothetical protein EMPS_00808 [Entomortierella parvispora]